MTRSLQTRTAFVEPERQPVRGELVADGLVHALGIVFALAAGTVLLVAAVYYTSVSEYVSLAFYVASLLAVFSISCAYNLWPVSPLKFLLRRADHAAIYLLIAGTYTPFLTQLPNSFMSVFLIAFIWISTGFGIAMKLLLPGRFDRLAVVFYLAIGWSGILVLDTLFGTLSTLAVVLVLAGGLTYSSGVVFYAWRSLKYQSALWHAFVVAGAVLHFLAIADTMVLERLA